MAKQYLIVNEDQIMVDLEVVFAAIREANGDWEQVETDLWGMLDTLNAVIESTQHADGDTDA